MAETPLVPPISTVLEPETVRYWCYHCDKRVAVETLPDLPDIVCSDCKNGFVESIAVSPPNPRIEGPSFNRQFLQVLRLIAQAAREEDDSRHPQPDPVPDPSPDAEDFLRIELDAWENENDNDNDNDNDDYGVLEESENEEDEEEDEEDGDRRRRRDFLRLRIRDFAARPSGVARDRNLDWSEILMGLEDNTIELRVEIPDTHGYVGDPEDYVDAAGYQELLQNLADNEGRRGAPPASKSALLALPTVEITAEDEGLVCAICKDAVSVGDTAKKLPCDHSYHGDCIVPWLGSRNSCPVCRFELPTDDPDYEEEKKKKCAGGSSNNGNNDHDTI